MSTYNVASSSGLCEHQSNPKIQAKVSRGPFLKKSPGPCGAALKRQNASVRGPWRCRNHPQHIGVPGNFEKQGSRGRGAFLSSWGKGPFQAWDMHTRAHAQDPSAAASPGPGLQSKLQPADKRQKTQSVGRLVSCVVHMARALCSLLMLCTRPKARVCSTRAA